MIKIYFSNSWGEDPNLLLKRYSKQTPGSSGIWKDIAGVTNKFDADFYILLDDDIFDKNIDKSKIIYIKREPNFIKNTPIESIPYKHIIHWDKSHCGITWWLEKTYDELISMPYPQKNKKISCVTTSKHNHRNQLIKKIVSNNNEIDLYGRGHDPNFYGSSYKGELNYNKNCKFNGLIDYQFSIVIENSQEKNYWTEKLADAYLSWCFPVYLGCPNLDDFFEKKSYISLNDDFLVNQLKTVNLDVSAIDDARKKILNDYNIWEIIFKKILEIKS